MSELAFELIPSEDERLLQAEELVRGFCGWHIATSRTETATIRGNGGRLLLLPSLYVTEVTSVTDGVNLLTIESDYVWTSAGVITRSAYWGTDMVTVEFTHGYDYPPADVAAVVQAVAQRAINNPGGQPSSKTIGPFSENYGALATGTSVSLLDSEKDVLRRYRIPAVA